MVKEPREAPGKLAGTRGLHVSSTDGRQSIINASPDKHAPIRVTQELIDSIRKQYPIEYVILDLCLKDGRAVIIESGGV